MSLAAMIQIVPLVLLLLVFAWKEGREIRMALDPKRMRANVLYRDGHITRHVVKIMIEGKAARFKIGGKTYRVVPELVYRTGLWRVPTSYYVVGTITPLDLGGKAAVGTYTAEDYHQATEHHVVEGLLNAFKTGILTPETTLILMALLIVGVGGGLWYTFGQRFDELTLLIHGATTEGGGGATLPNEIGVVPVLPGR